MTPEQGIQRLYEIIQYDLRPEHYKETVAISKQARMFHAKESEKQREELEQIRKTETREQIDQRVRLTNAVTSVALAPVYAYVEAVWRTDGISKAIETKATDTVKTRVDGHYAKFYKAESLHRYCFNAAVQYTKIDPNAWTIFEAMFAQTARGEAVINDFYPVDVMSEEVRSVGEDQTGKVEHLAFEFKRTVYDPNNMQNKRQLSDFYLYAAGFSIHFAEFDDTYVDGKDYEAMGYVAGTVPETGRNFWMQTFTNSTIEVPAIRWSAYLSHDHGRKVGETLVANAIPILEELLKDNSLLQLIKYIHAYPKLAEYVRRCKHIDETGRECINGYYGGLQTADHQCKQCKGSGKLLVQSEQDAITLAWPHRSEDMVELSKISHYFERPVDILIQYREMVREKSGEILSAVFNQQNVDPRQLTQTETATQVRLEFDKIYNKLSPFAELVSLAWELGIRVGYQYYKAEAIANMTYPHDFKMKTIIDLLIELDAAKNAGAPYNVTQSITADILTKQYRNNPTKAADIVALERWKPWKGKNAEDIALIIQSRDTTDPDRVLWENWEQVVEQVKLGLDPIPFSVLPPDQQRELLYRTAAEMIGAIVYTQIPDPFAAEIPIGEPVDDEIPE